jgi:hypothetical protein
MAAFARGKTETSDGATADAILLPDFGHLDICAPQFTHGIITSIGIEAISRTSPVLFEAIDPNHSGIGMGMHHNEVSKMFKPPLTFRFHDIDDMFESSKMTGWRHVYTADDFSGITAKYGDVLGERTYNPESFKAGLSLKFNYVGHDPKNAVVPSGGKYFVYERARSNEKIKPGTRMQVQYACDGNVGILSRVG